MSEDGRDSVTLILMKFSHFDRMCICFLGNEKLLAIEELQTGAIETHECKEKCYEEHFVEGRGRKDSNMNFI